jgi:transposase
MPPKQCRRSNSSTINAKNCGRRNTLGIAEYHSTRSSAPLEACGGAHHWARQLTQLGHEVPLVPPAYVKPFVKRQKKRRDRCRGDLRSGAAPQHAVERQQAAGLVFRARDLLVRQRTQLINAIRGHLTEYGWIAPKGPSHVTMLADLLEEEEMASSLPEAARAMFRLMLDLLAPGP